MTSHRRCLSVPFLVVALLGSAAAQQLPFRHAIELALKHSGLMAIAAADQVRARQGYLEARNGFIPNLVVGSGLGYSYGYPMSIEGAAPTIFNVNTQSFLVNFAQRSFVKAARIDWMATNISSEDKRSQVILDAALTWTELDKVLSELKLLRDQQQNAARQEDITAQRVAAGVETAVELTRAKLATARVRMKAAELASTADVLRSHLGFLTGLPADTLETDPESLPTLPAPPNDPGLAARAVSQSPAVRLADEAARAKDERARAEHQQLYPSLDFAGSYGLFAKFNNYDQFFKKFQSNNFTIGAGIRFPIFNSSQKARAAGADADALVAHKQAEAVRNQVSTDVLKLQGAVRQLSAARDVARLEYDLARSATEAASVRVQSGQANLREEQAARLDEADRYSAFLDASFELQKAQLRLLHQAGQLEAWAMGN